VSPRELREPNENYKGDFCEHHEQRQLPNKIDQDHDERRSTIVDESKKVDLTLAASRRTPQDPRASPKANCASNKLGVTMTAVAPEEDLLPVERVHLVDEALGRSRAERIRPAPQPAWRSKSAL